MEKAAAWIETSNMITHVEYSNGSKWYEFTILTIILLRTNKEKAKNVNDLNFCMQSTLSVKELEKRNFGFTEFLKKSNLGLTVSFLVWFELSYK